ncbi:MAG: diaminopimelate epimerase [Thermodesulfovibrionales bacterium]|nr:diaminopimelate epimerase [Thermodesulfovibrionales bacterium]
MYIDFVKMQGTGNDFVLIDCLQNVEFCKTKDLSQIARYLCDRRFGVGADQILLLRPSDKADFMMDIYNADGSQVEMCGNGIRCIARYIWDKGLSKGEILNIETLAGIIRPKKEGNLVSVDMGEPIFLPDLIPTTINTNPPIVDYPIHVLDKDFKITCLSMGNPHAVIVLDEEIDSFDVVKYGSIIETHSLFPKRINVEFINIVDRNTIKMRVWERGSGETLACGTGACASAVACMIKGLVEKDVEVRLRGGNLYISWAQDKHVYMKGPAEEVFRGRIKIDIH